MAVVQYEFMQKGETNPLFTIENQVESKRDSTFEVSHIHTFKSNEIYTSKTRKRMHVQQEAQRIIRIFLL